MSTIYENLPKKFGCKFFKSFLVLFFFILIFGYSPVSKKAYAINIYTIEDLDSIRNDLTGDHFLMNNLDFNSDASYSDPANKILYTTGEGWDPIGVNVSGSEFTGTFDGNGHTISNLYINNTTDRHAGLFGYAYSSSISDVGVLNTNITATSVVGGLIAYNRGTISNSYSTGSVGGSDSAGGLVGFNRGTINNSYSKSYVTGLEFVGGLAGSNSGVINGSYSTGATAGNRYVGGLVGGNNDEGTITESYSTGPVVASVGRSGGFVGANKGSVSDSYWDTETSGMSASEGGVGKTTLEMQSIITFTNWDIVDISVFDESNPNVWYLNEGKDYPRLFWEFEGYNPGNTIPHNKVFHQDRRCHWKKPNHPTWIKLEPKEENGVKGMLLTWTQYDADRVNIKIDDGTGKYPWKIVKTLNDGHEFLPNVGSWQNIMIKPINHCKEGEYSLAVSHLAYPYGWYGQSGSNLALATGRSANSYVFGTSADSEEASSKDTPMVPETGSDDILYLATSLLIIGFSSYFVLNEKSRRFALRDFERRVSQGL